MPVPGMAVYVISGKFQVKRSNFNSKNLEEVGI